jgi:hypothetical protein
MQHHALLKTSPHPPLSHRERERERELVFLSFPEDQ